MPVITIETPFNIDLEFRIASFSKRFSAWLIDIVVICLYYYVMLRFIYPLLGLSSAIRTASALFFIIIPVLLYQLAFELAMDGQTLGKKAVGIKIIDAEGREPTWGQYIIRWALCLGNLFLYVVPYIILHSPALIIFFMVLYLPDFICVMVSSKSQRIGDYAAGTVVIDNSYRPDISETIYLDIEEDNYEPMYPEVMRLTDRDINGIRNLLNMKRPTRDAEQYIIDVALKIKTVLNIQSDLYPTDFLKQLLKDYNFLTRNKTPNP